MAERLHINGVNVPLLNSLNPSLTFSVADISQPDKRKSTFSKTISLPNSKIATELFGGVFDINSVDSSFDTTKKADMFYEVDGEIIMEGYLQLKSIDSTDINEIKYNVVLFGNTANLFSKIKGKFLEDLDMSTFNHALTTDIVIQSWDTDIIKDGLPIPFELGIGYVYPLIDYGYSSDQMTYDVTEMAPAIYAKQYLDKIFESIGSTYTSAFFNSDLFKRLIIPSDPSTYALNSQDIADRQFSSNTPKFVDTDTTQSLALVENSAPPDSTIKMTVDVNDPSGIYNNTTGEYTANFNGIYNLNTIIDLDATFVPDDLVTSLSVTSEIRGYLSILKNGSAVDSIDFYISPIGFATGSRDTINPPSGIATHRQNLSTSVATPAAGRTQSPPNRYVLNMNHISLNAGDVIEVSISANWVGFGSMFKNILGTNFSGQCYLNASVGGFSNTIVNQSVGYGNIIDINRTIPKKYKQEDFLKDFIKMFNLQVEPNKLIRNDFIIEPYDDYYLTSKVNDWREKHSINKPSKLTPTGRQKNKVYTYDFKKDGDHYNTLYNDTYQDNYGHREVEAENEFLKGTYKTEVTLSPTPLVGDPNAEIVIPRIVKLNDNQESIPTKFNRRVLYYGGLKGNPNGGNLITPWKLSRTISITPLNQYEYAYAGHFNDPFNATLDINFGIVREVYYDDNLATINSTNANLYNVFHKNMMDLILSKEGRIFEGYFHLTPTDIHLLSFRDLFYHNNANWRLLKISNYNPTSDELVKCEFQKVVNLDLPNVVYTYPIDGGVEADSGPRSADAPINDIELLPSKNLVSNKQEDSNSYNPKTTTISGENNYVNRTATNIDIFGNNNTVSSDVDGVKLINSSNNFISAGVENVTLINSNYLNITDSNVTYYNGTLVNNDLDHHSGVNNIKIDETVVVSKDKQMTNWNKLTNNGTLTVEGDLILR